MTAVPMRNRVICGGAVCGCFFVLAFCFNLVTSSLLSWLHLWLLEWLLCLAVSLQI